MLKRLLIANRGEIARRIIRTARRLGVETVAVYSDADACSPHAREADQAVRLGPARARESYLDGAKVLAAAQSSGADSVHPGYGFLSENADFAQAVIEAGLIWVGPPPSAIRAMGLKDAAKRLMAAAGVPVTPGYLGEDQSPERLAAEATRIGYPVLIKAVAGGGGKGMRRVEAAADFAAALDGAKREGAASFGDDRVLLETYVTRPRHIEVQVFADSHGQVVHLFERDCSLQRRHQKVIEEAPAPGMDAATREAVTLAAIKAARAVSYQGAGTVEFIADASDGLRADRIWFMEMNTRLQVEHPVTEAVTGLDLVEWQLRVASGEALPLAQDQITLTGHAIEGRLYAENPATGFLPSTGRLERFRLPASVRVDSSVEEGGEVTPFYDPMIAKLIAHAPTRQAAAAQLASACRAVEVWPVKTNAAFLARCLDHPDFIAGQVDTGFIGARLDALTTAHPAPLPVVASAVGWWAKRFADAQASPGTPWGGSPSGLFGFRLNAAPASSVSTPFIVNAKAYVLDLSIVGRGTPAWRLDVTVDGDPLQDGKGVAPPTFGEAAGPMAHGPIHLFWEGEAFNISFQNQAQGGPANVSNGQITAPMPGRIVQVAGKVGDAVAKGDALVTLEAMKMEHTLCAPFDGKVTQLSVHMGDQVSEGKILACVTASDAVAPS